MRKISSLKPLQVYLIGAGVALLSGILIRPWNDTIHSVLTFVALLICIAGMVKYFRS